MLFEFQKYLQPTHYFLLFKKDGSSIFPLAGKIPKEVLAQLKACPDYKSKSALEYDLSWQAVQKGYIGNTETYSTFDKLPIVDEYRFVQMYFNPIWALYILVLRILSFKNPIAEVSAWQKTRKVKRSRYLENPLVYPDWESFDSPLIKSRPLVSVVIPTLNRYEYLKDVLQDLEKQEYQNCEVLIVDQSEPFQKGFYEGFNLKVNLIRQTEKALWLARNLAIEASAGEYILLFDDDSRVGPDWIQMHLKCLDYFKATISSGVSISSRGAEVPKNYSFFNVSSQLDTGNVLIKKSLFREIGLFDRQFEKQRMGDGEFGLRAFVNGYLNVSNPFAKRLHLKVASGGLREMGSWDAFRPKKWFAPRPIPSVLYFFRKYYGTKRTGLALLKTVPPSLMPYRFKKNKKMLWAGVLISLLLFPVVLVQVGISWRMATAKLKQGARISELK